MEQRINKAYDQQSRSLSESLNQRGLYRTGLYDQLQHQMVEDPRQQALTQAATDVYISGQDATRQAVQNAMAMALGLGGQQVGLQQQYLQNLLGIGSLQNQMALQPFQMGLNLWNAIYGPEQSQKNQATASTFQSIGNFVGSILPWLFFL
jgi:TATA-box binding protein (TBP) (component of TFIID and TFIIIB)